MLYTIHYTLYTIYYILYAIFVPGGYIVYMYLVDTTYCILYILYNIVYSMYVPGGYSSGDAQRQHEAHGVGGLLDGHGRQLPLCKR